MRAEQSPLFQIADQLRYRPVGLHPRALMAAFVRVPKTERNVFGGDLDEARPLSSTAGQ